MLQEYIKINLRNSFIKRSKSPAGAPILFIKKKDRFLYLHINYRRLNYIIIKDWYLIPLTLEILKRPRQAKFWHGERSGRVYCVLFICYEERREEKTTDNPHTKHVGASQALLPSPSRMWNACLCRANRDIIPPPLTCWAPRDVLILGLFRYIWWNAVSNWAQL